MGVETKVDRLQDILKTLHSIAQKDVLVGVPDSAPERDDDAEYSNAQIGYINEFGSPPNNIPARPHLIAGVEAIEEQAAGILKRGGQRALAGDAQAVDQSLHAAGLLAVNSVRKTIQEGDFVPLAPYTLQKRREAGRTGDKPLLDTGQYRNSQTYVVRKKDK